MEERIQRESQYLYMIKGIACFLVVFLHFGIVYMGGIYELTRIAVPIFFIIQGRFLSIQMDNEDYKEHRQRNCQTVFKLLKITLMISWIYILFSFFFWIICDGADFKQWLVLKFSPIEWIKLLVFNTSKIIYDDILFFDHQWYLYAALIAIIIIVLVQRFINQNTVFILMIPLLLRLINQYTWKITEGGVWIGKFFVEEMHWTRNFLFTALPFIAYGIFLQYIGKIPVKRITRTIWKIFLFVGVAVGIILTYMEYSKYGNQELYIGSTLIAICLTTMGIFVNKNSPKVLVWVGKYLSKDVYYWHPLVFAILERVLPVQIRMEWYPFYVFISTVFVVIIGLGIKKVYERKIIN